MRRERITAERKLQARRRVGAFLRCWELMCCSLIVVGKSRPGFDCRVEDWQEVLEELYSPPGVDVPEYFVVYRDAQGYPCWDDTLPDPSHPHIDLDDYWVSVFPTHDFVGKMVATLRRLWSDALVKRPPSLGVFDSWANVRQYWAELSGKASSWDEAWDRFQERLARTKSRWLAALRRSKSRGRRRTSTVVPKIILVEDREASTFRAWFPDQHWTSDPAPYNNQLLDLHQLIADRSEIKETTVSYDDICRKLWKKQYGSMILEAPVKHVRQRVRQVVSRFNQAWRNAIRNAMEDGEPNEGVSEVNLLQRGRRGDDCWIIQVVSFITKEDKEAAEQVRRQRQAREGVSDQ